MTIRTRPVPYAPEVGVRAGAAERPEQLLSAQPHWHRQPGLPCRVDPEMWFPESRGPRFRVVAAPAIDLCNTECPVLTECLAWALDKRPEFGVWGGHTVRELAAIRAAAPATEPPEGGSHRPARGPTCGHGEADGRDDGHRWRCKVCARTQAQARRKNERAAARVA